MRILLVDDDLMVLRSLWRMLREHAVTQAPGGNSALAILKSGQKFDAIVCDLNMPAMRGEAFFDALQAEMPDQAARILFMTGGTGPGADRFLEEHARLLKPFTREELEQALRPFAPAAPEAHP